MRQLLALLTALVALVPLQADDDPIEATLRAALVPPEGPGLVEYFRRRCVSNEQMARINEQVARLGDESYAVRERATLWLCEAGLPAVGPLRAALNSRDVEVVRRAEKCLRHIEPVPSHTVAAAALKQVGRKKPAGAAGPVLAFLPFADDQAVADEARETLAALAVRDGRPDPDLLAALTSPISVVRGAAGEALIRHGVADARKLVADPDADVRLRTALALVAYAKDKSAVPVIIALLAEPPPLPIWRAHELLVRLAGESAPSVTVGADVESRQKCRDVWKAWWDKHENTIDLAKLGDLPRSLGRTLIVESTAGSVNGRVLEINHERIEVWSIKGLKFPTDAVMVDDNHVLIAERNANEVALWTIHGKKVWTKSIVQPQSIQALPGGHVLVSSRRLLVEFDEQQREVFSLPRDRSDLLAAAKDIGPGRPGHYILVINNGDVVRIDRQKKEEIGTFSTGTRTATYASVDVLPSGNIVVAHPGGVSEFRPDHKASDPKVWTASQSGQITSVQRLANGGTLIAGTSSRKVIEFDRAGKVVWEYQPADNGTPWRARRR